MEPVLKSQIVLVFSRDVVRHCEIIQILWSRIKIGRTSMLMCIGVFYLFWYVYLPINCDQNYASNYKGKWHLSFILMALLAQPITVGTNSKPVRVYTKHITIYSIRIKFGTVWYIPAYFVTSVLLFCIFAEYMWVNWGNCNQIQPSTPIQTTKNVTKSASSGTNSLVNQIDPDNEYIKYMIKLAI